MASDVDLGNLMLSHLGDDATVSNLNPPEGSSQAEHVATFFPIARDSLLEMHNWRFATRRAPLAETTLPVGAGWQYAYLAPANFIQVFAVIPPDSQNDYSVPFDGMDRYGFYQNEFASGAVYITQDFAMESDDNGNDIILTNCPNAIGRFIIRVTDTTKFSPLFNDTFGWYGASMLAGPIIKGDVGAAEGKRCLQLAMVFLGKAATADSRNQQITPKQNVSWISNR